MNQDEYPPTDPDEYLRKQGYKKKLDGETELVKLLLQKRYSAYMVWRYLVEERRLDVSRNTVLRFTRSIRSEATPDPQADARVSKGRLIMEAPTNDAIHVSVDPPSSRPPITREVSASSAAHSVALGSGQEPADALRTTFTRDAPLPERNAERGSAAFEAEGEQTKQRIATSRSSAIAPAPDILRPFDASDPAFIAEERKLRWPGKKRT
jgi:hypothetical protein